MDVYKLSRIDEELDSSEVAALCFLCSDVLGRRRLETVKDGKELFVRLSEKGLLDNHFFLAQLLNTIRRTDLLSLLETDSSPTEGSLDPQTDANPVLSDYRVMLYRIYEDMTQDTLRHMKFLLGSDLGRGQIESCTTALDVFGEMERANLLANNKLETLEKILRECDVTLAEEIPRYRGGGIPYQARPAPHFSMDNQRGINPPQPLQHSLSVSETQPSCASEGRSVFSDSQTISQSQTIMPNPSLHDEMDYYELTHNPRGVCMIINNELFQGNWLRNRPGTEKDEKSLRSVFTSLGFQVEVYNDMTADGIRHELRNLGERNFLEDDALVVCVLSHGDMGCVFGTDERKVTLRELTLPFTSKRAPTLAGKPKLFFIQACQGSDYQEGAMPCPPTLQQEERGRSAGLEEDAGPVQSESVPLDADFLFGMATVQECKSFRNTSTGSIYIQELCKQLDISASRQEDINTVLTRVNRYVSKGEYLNKKQMPEPKYTLTKKLVLTFV